MQRILVAVEVFDEGANATFIFEHVALVVALIDQFDVHTRVEKGQFPQPFGENVVMIFNVGEDGAAGLETNGGARDIAVSHLRQGTIGITHMIDLLVDFAVAMNGELQFFRQGIDHRYAHAVQSAGDLVGVAVELPAGMEHGHDDLGGGASFVGMDIHGNTPAVVSDGHRTVGVNRHQNLRTVAGQGLIDGIIDHLEHHMVESGSIIRIPDIHPGAFTHGIKPF